MPPKRVPNRLLVLCASINDVTAWPFWKFLQMKKIRGVTDMALLAFNSEGGSFEARIDGEKYHLKNYAKVRGYQQDMFESFVHRWYDPGRSYFVYGGHGMGDYMELEQDKVSLQAHELAAVFGNRTFEAMLFDACFMANIDCAYHLRHNTRYIGACEGYMWEPDTALDYHVFNTHNASAMSRYKDPLHILRTIQADYCAKAARGDFSIIDTTHVEELRQYVQDHVIQRAYDRATFYSLPQQERLQQLAESASQAAIAEFGHPGGDSNVLPNIVSGLGRPRTAPVRPGALALSAATRPTRQQRLQQAIQFEHALYPSEAEDKQLLDLKSYLTDIAQEAQQKEAWTLAAAGPQRRIAAGRRRVRAGVSSAASAATAHASSSFAAWHAPPSRACSVDRHGRLPPAAPAVVKASSSAPSASIVTPIAVSESLMMMASSNRRSVPPAVAAELEKVETAATPSVLTSDSPGYKGCPQEGLDLFQKVVLSHVGPKASPIYAAHLGGLSFTIHEYCTMSRPLEPWAVDSKRLLRRRAKQFLKNGELSEVTMESTRKSTAAAMNRVLLDAVSEAGTAAAASASSSSSSSFFSPVAETDGMETGSDVETGSSGGNGVPGPEMEDCRPGVPVSSSSSFSLSSRSVDSIESTLSSCSSSLEQRALSYPQSPLSQQRTSAMGGPSFL